MERRNWNREELILAFNLYCKIPFGSFHTRNKYVLELAKLLKRTPGSIALKLSNFASFDPFHKNRGVKGMVNASKLDKEIFEEFTSNWDKLVFESEQILAQKEKTTLEKKYPFFFDDFNKQKGEEKARVVKTRVNQYFFRKMILAIYDCRCAISGIDIPDLLIASHIIPWSANENQRVNPENGICLSPLYDKCFDKGYITITTDYKILLSSPLKERFSNNYFSTYFHSIEDKKIILPTRFLPGKDFLVYHNENIFLG